MLTWLEPLRYILAFIFVLGLVVFVHELGHFLAAKATGVYAPRFSIGFGRALWSRKWGETEYILAAIPLGGYVRLASKEDEAMAALEGGTERPAAAPDAVGGSGAPPISEGISEAKPPKYWDPNALAPFGPIPVPQDRLFESKSLPARLVIMTAGVTMNVVLGFALLSGLALYYGRVIVPTRVIGEVNERVHGSERADIVSGDTLVSVDGRPVSTWNDYADAILASDRDIVELRTTRSVARVSVGMAGRPERAELLDLITPATPPIVGRVVDGTPAARVGLAAGDTIVAVDGTPVRAWEDVVLLIRRSPERELRLEVGRAGGRRTLTVRPERHKERIAGTRRDTIIGRIGATNALPDYRRDPIGVVEAVGTGWTATWDMAGAVVSVLHRLVKREMPADQLGGPIAIARASGDAARGGFASLLRLTALLSINVAVFNLLPIPILDGGQILINVLQAVKGSPFSLRSREYMMRFGLAVIALIFALAMFNDLRRAAVDLLRRFG